MFAKQQLSKRRRSVWDEKSKEREFVVGEEVLVRKPGINMKLCKSCEGPFKVIKNSPLSYGVDTGDRKLPSVHVQLMKKFHKSPDKPKVGRVTSMFEPDTLEDILDRLSDLSVSGKELEGKQAEDIRQVEQQFKDILTKEPVLFSRILYRHGRA